MPIAYLKAMFGLRPTETHISTPRGTERRFLEIARRIQNTDALVAIYVPENTLPVYSSTAHLGRVVGVVRLLPMPPNRRPQDYNWLDFDGSNRWPVGWPSEVVSAPEPERCPRLRDLVAELFPRVTFASYTARLEGGPFPLEDRMAQRLKAELLSPAQ